MFTVFGTISQGPPISQPWAMCAQESPMFKAIIPTDFGWGGRRETGSRRQG